MLLIDCCTNSGLELQLHEGTSSARSLVKFRGKFQEAGAVNKNKRMYTYETLNNNLAKLQEAIADRRLVGELDHPTDSILHFANASHLVTKLWWDGNVLMGEGEILNTPHGKVLKALVEDGVKVGISSRGVGSGKVNENGILVIDESYKLITFDVVADPSTYSAFQEKVISKKESVEPSRIDVFSQIRKESAKTFTKNENTHIDTVSKEALIACLGGFVKSQAEVIKSRLANG